MHSAQGYLLKSFREKTLKRRVPKVSPSNKRKKNGKKRDKKRENHIPLHKNWRIPGAKSRLNRDPSLDLKSHQRNNWIIWPNLIIFSNLPSTSSLKSLVSSKSSTLLSELEFYDYHEGKPFTSQVITKRILSIKETKTSFRNNHSGGSVENSKSKLKFTGRGISLAPQIKRSTNKLIKYHFKIGLNELFARMRTIWWLWNQ